MSSYYYAFYVPIEKKDVPAKLEKWDAVTGIMEERWRNDRNKGIWMTQSLEAMNERFLRLICQGLAIYDLDFLQTEIICLETEKLERVRNALERIVAWINSGVPLLGPEIENAKEFRHWYRSNGRDDLAPELHLKAFAEAQPTSYQPMFHGEYGELVVFYTYLKSLLAVVNQCLEANQNLIYIWPALKIYAAIVGLG